MEGKIDCVNENCKAEKLNVIEHGIETGLEPDIIQYEVKCPNCGEEYLFVFSLDYHQRIEED